jgi:hypothetical protein
LQLFISRDRHAQDARSLNGTAINARFLRYGTERELRDRDLISIAGVAVFRFSVAEPLVVPFIPASVPKPSPPTEGAWAILIDGASKTAIPLVESGYFLARGKSGNISLGNAKNEGNLLRITRANTEIGVELETLETSDEYHLFAMFKYEDRFYLATGIPSRTRVSEFLKDRRSGKQISGTEYTSKMSFCFGQSSQGQSRTLDGVETELVVINSDDLPNCTLGPFQIVRF